MDLGKGEFFELVENRKYKRSRGEGEVCFVDIIMVAYRFIF